MTRFGVQLHGTFPMTSYTELARAVERHPFDELTVHDVAWWRPVWPILTLVAGATRRVEIGPDVTHPYLQHPLVTAGNLAAIDELSGGRAVLGVGRGSMLEPLGISRAGSEDAVREMVGLVRHLLEGRRERFDGRHFQADERAALLWRPRRAGIPVFVGAFGPRMVESAAAWADEIRPPGTWRTEFFIDLKARAETSARAAGRTVRVGCEVWLALDRDRDRARRLGRRVLCRFLPSMRAMTDFYRIDAEELAAVGMRLDAGDLDAAAACVSDATLDTFVAAGDPEQIADGVRRLVAAGTAGVTFSGRLGEEPLQAIELLGSEVLPRVT